MSSARAVLVTPPTLISDFDSIKIEALATLALLFDMRVDCRLSMLVHNYEQDFETFELGK